MDNFEQFEEIERKIFKLCNGVKVCLWGYGYSGRFCEHLFRRANKQIEHIIDDSAVIDSKVDVERSLILKELDSDTHIVLCAFARDEKVITFLERLGYQENHNFIFIREWFYGNAESYRKLSYYDWLEYFYRLDITLCVMDNARPKGDCNYYSPGIDYSIIDILDHFEFDLDDAVFDFGCGKGGALCLFRAAGISRIGGVEYDQGLYEIAVSNMRKMNLDSQGIINDDAAKVAEQLDNYNYFFMYNPFQGQTFEAVVRNLEDSFKRKKRKMCVIYSGPYCHEILVRNEIFKFSKTIKTDYSVKNVRIYCTNIR